METQSPATHQGLKMSTEDEDTQPKPLKITKADGTVTVVESGVLRRRRRKKRKRRKKEPVPTDYAAVQRIQRGMKRRDKKVHRVRSEERRVGKRVKPGWWRN